VVQSRPSMSGRVCLVTGAGSGIGKPTAIELAKAGATVVIVCRSRERGEAARRDISRKSRNDAVELMVADLSSQREIRRLAAEFEDKHDRLDVLVNNAAVMLKHRSVTTDGIETTFAVNHLAYFLLTNLLLPSLERSGPARVVNVASTAHHSGRIDFDDLQNERGYSMMGSYSGSKLANILFTYELARRLEGTGVTANCLHPGVVATSLFRELPKLILAPAKLFFISPEKGAETSVYLAMSPEVEGITGKYFIKRREARSSPASYDDEVARRLWQVSASLTEVTEH